MKRIRDIITGKNMRTQGILLGVGLVILLAGCTAKGEGSADEPAQPSNDGGATVGAKGGSAPSNGLFGALVALGIAGAMIAVRRNKGE